jgi:hypothetical protein
VTAVRLDSLGPWSPDAAEALRRTAVLGGFFTVDLEPDSVAWQPFSALLAPDSPVLRAEVVALRARLAAQAGVAIDEVAPRVAASLWFLGWSARLVSPWLAATAIAGGAPVLPPDQLLWQPTRAQPVRLAVRDIADAALAGPDDLYAACVEALVRPLLAATAETFPVSRRLLWGNVASAAAGAAAAAATMVPTRAVAARAALDRLLTTGELVGQGEWRGPVFVRRSCCLLYRVPGAGLCGDCVLAHR